MCQGYHRQTVEHWRHTRQVVAMLYNVNRGPDAEYLRPEEFMPLPGDAPRQLGLDLTDNEYREAQARLDKLDADLL